MLSDMPVVQPHTGPPDASGYARPHNHLVPVGRDNPGGQ